MKSLNKMMKYAKNHKWVSFAFEIFLIIGILALFSWYQNRGTLPADGSLAPDFNLTSITGEKYQLSSFRGKKVLVYFFAPWCNICHLSADNLNDLRTARSDEELMILVVGLSYDYESEIQKFATELALNVPVLYGTTQQLEDYKIKGFPTYYVIDSGGRVTHKSIGYSFELGLRLRT